MKKQDVEVAHPHRNREAGGAMGEAKVNQSKVRKMLLRCDNSAIEVVGGSHHPIAGLVPDQIFERRRQLDVIFDDQDLHHRPRSSQLKDKSLSLNRMLL
jgi:hypothetical protein